MFLGKRRCGSRRQHKAINHKRFGKDFAQSNNSSSSEKLSGSHGSSLLFFALNLKKEATLWKIVAGALLLILLSLPIIEKIEHSDTQKSLNLDPVTLQQIPKMGNIIVKINLSGVISDNPYRNNAIRKLGKLENVQGILLSINSPGGGAGASEILYSVIKAISDEKPVVANIRSLGASGAYYVAIGADKIFAHKMSFVGSIGVISNYPKYYEAMGKLGISQEIYRSSIFKASPTSAEKTPKAVQEYITQTLQEAHQIFKTEVQKRRSLSDKELSVVTNGKIFNGKRALELKLIDKIGTETESIEYLRSTLSEENQDIPVVEVSLKKPTKGFEAFTRGAISSAILSFKTSVTKQEEIMATM